MSNILLVDDDIELSELLLEYLEAEGFELDVLHDGDAVLPKVNENNYELIILDVMLPGKNGFEILRELRNNHNVPVLMLTAKGDDVDRIVGLEMGADDYLPKPCNPRELVARIKAILRRSENIEDKVNDGIINKDQIAVHTHSRDVYLAEDKVKLTSSEYNILECLIGHAGKVVTKSELTKQALNKSLTAYDRSLDMHVSNLRNKLGSSPSGEQYVKTIRGVGYMFID
tara:strand:- start:164309 stop:164992 length:684 start_codon:yes stop_codon:yes gene_type:complete